MSDKPYTLLLKNGHLIDPANGRDERADGALLRLSRGQFGYWDCGRGRMVGDQRLECLLTVRAGQVVYDREGMTMADWRTLGPAY
ncbi:MAG TPA: hypothetical protein VG370_30970 [Chloroflexota bacterium]|jgi:dihydroorotase|nr:hypothetical protein [Chloroflexota bacterium]